MTIKKKSKNAVITFIPMQIYRKTWVLKTKGVEPSVGVVCHTKSIFPKHNLEAGTTSSLCTFSQVKIETGFMQHNWIY